MSTLSARAVARPSKFTPERQQRILDALSAGNTRRAAAAYGGVDEGTFERWLRRYAGFAGAVKKAESDAEVRAVAQVAQAAQDGTWQAAAWWLERRRPHDFGRRERVEIDVRHYAERVAGELGLNVDELLAEAERIVRHGRD